MKNSYQREIKTVIDLISISVRTAPKSGGVDDIILLAANIKQKNSIAFEMINIGKEKAKSQADRKVSQAMETSWASDAKTVKDSQGLILVGVKGKKIFGANCGGCGFKNCAEFQGYVSKNKNNLVLGPFCMFKIWDLGIAVASAANTAAMLKIDNRIMYRIGIAASRLKIFKQGAVTNKDISSQINPILGLPLSVSGKNIFFDRFDKAQADKVLKGFFSRNR